MKLKKLAVAALMAGATITSGAYAAYINWWTLTEYYSDASMTTHVGTRLRNCKGQVATSGTVTAYKQIVEQYNCAYPLP